MDYVSSVLQGISSYRWLFPSGGIAASTLLLIAVYARIRAGSSFVVWDLIWRRLAGKDAFKNPKMKEFFEDNKDAERYRFIYRLRVGTAARAERLTEFLRQHDISIAELRKIKPWAKIDGPTIALNPVSVIEQPLLLGGVAIGLLFFWLSVGIGFYGSALLETIQTKVWFVSNGEIISHFWRGGSVNLQLCSHDPSVIQNGIGFSEAETASICKFYQNGEFLSFVHRTLFQQRVAAAVMAIISFSGLYWCVVRFDSVTLAKKLKSRVEQ